MSLSLGILLKYEVPKHRMIGEDGGFRPKKIGTEFL